MAEDDKPSSQKPSSELAQIDERLKYLESIARETVSRLYLIETRLGIGHRDPWVKREQPAQPTAPPSPPRVQAPPAAPQIPAGRQPTTAPSQGQGESASPYRPPASVPPQGQPPQPPAPPRPSVHEQSRTSPPAGPQTGIDASEAARQAQPDRPAQAARVLGTPTLASVNPPRKPRGDLEARIGGTWFNRIGVIAIVLGVAYAFKVAYDQDWIGRWGWVSIGIALGLAFLIGGEKTRRRYANYAFGLTGCGISLLYVSIYAASAQWKLVPNPVAFLMMALVTATASLLSARYSALPIALLGLLGGFLTPFLLSTGQDNEVGLFGYVALLDLGVLTLAYSKHWRSLNYLAFVATQLTFFAWYFEFYEPPKLGTTITFLTIFFAIFALLAVLYNVVNRRATKWLDLILVFANALIYFATAYVLLEQKYDNILGAFAILVAAFYLCLGFLTYRRDKEDTLLVHTFLGLGFLFSVLAVPIQFNQHWVTMAWAIEGAVMTWVGLKARDGTSRFAGLVVFVIAAGHWLGVDVRDFSFSNASDFVPLFNPRALSCAVLVASLGVAARMYHKDRDVVEEGERSMFNSLYTLAANAAAILLLSLDANDYFMKSRQLGSWAGRDYGAWDNSRQFVLSSLWTVYGVAILIVGITRNQMVLRVIAATLLALTTVKVLVLDVAYHQAPWHLTVFNETFASLVMLVFGFAASAWVYSKSAVPAEERRPAMGALILAANILALVALTTEPIGFFHREISEATRLSAPERDLLQLTSSMHFVLTAIWSVYAAVALAIGFRRNSKSVRIGAILLLGFTAAKLLAVDAQYYRADWHLFLANQTFGAFAIVIGVMSFALALYFRFEGEADERPVIPLLMTAANVLAVIALSLEVIGHFAREIHVGSTLETASRLRDLMQLSLTAIWAGYASAAMIVGTRRNSKGTRFGALLLLALAAGKVLFVDLEYYAANWHRLIFNETFGAFALVVAAMALSVWAYSSIREDASEEHKVVVPLLIAVANIFSIIGLSAEAYGYFLVKLGAAGLSPADADTLRFEQQLSISLIWAVYGGGMLIVGIWRRNRMLRVMSLVLLGATIVKVFLLDLASLKRIYLTISLIVLGIILVAVSYLYHRYRQRTDEVDGGPEPEPGEI
ncbi:MAG TPA: DUF2339 domain-containing protein [Blastocatellia bacterium]|nr:DUF2339 domain-containing protein [Blastocatellia bacterium]